MSSAERLTLTPEPAGAAIARRFFDPSEVYTASGMRWFLVLSALPAVSALLSAEVRFNRDIRPIMSQTCFRCHGPDKNARMAGMRLDIREEALRRTASGVVPIMPGDPGQSAI